jgi:hypothetical protein
MDHSERKMRGKRDKEMPRRERQNNGSNSNNRKKQTYRSHNIFLIEIVTRKSTTSNTRSRELIGQAKRKALSR